MEAIEFVTDAKGGVIKIPKKYLQKVGETVRVILLIDEAHHEKKVVKKKRLSALEIDTKGLKFDRNEANER